MIEGYTSTLAGKSGGKGDEKSLQDNTSGDNVGRGPGARFQYPSGACSYSSSDVALVEAVGSDSTVSCFFGNGKRGSALNSESPLECQLNSPQGVSYDRNNDIVYIADTGNNRIVKYDVKLKKISQVEIKT